MEGYEGALARPSCQEISGWAWDGGRPNVPIRVDIYDGDTLLGAVLADRPRPDLAGGGKGDGRHGFAFAVPRALADGNLHVIRVKFEGTDIDLRNSPQLLRCPE
jgi:hypothetical protein